MMPKITLPGRAADEGLSRLETALHWVLQLSLQAWIVLTLACALFIALGTDEAWNLMGIRSLLIEPRADYTSPLLFTSGGPFSAANLLIEALGGSQVWAHRLFSWGCLMATLLILKQRWRRQDHSAAAALIALTPLIGLTGTAVVGTSVLGAPVGILLSLLAIWYWSEHPDQTFGTATVCGLLFGLAATSRTELVFLFPALFATALLRFRPRIHLEMRNLPTTLWTAAIGMALVVGHYVLCRATMPSEASLGLAPTGAGLPAVLDYPRFLNKIAIGQFFGPLPLLVLATIMAVWTGPNGNASRPTRHRFLVFLAWLGWCLWVVWHTNSPIAHLRYLWPSLVCFAVLLGDGIARVFDQATGAAGKPWRVACLLVGLAFMASAVGTSFRSVVLGDQDILSWEWSHEIGFDYYRRFQYPRDQIATAAYLRDQIPPEDRVVCDAQPFTLRYLTGRPIVMLPDFLGTSDGRVNHLVLTPATGSYLYLRPEAYDWIASQGRLEAQFGSYSIYELPSDIPSDAWFLRPARTNYERHPLSRYRFGRKDPASAIANEAELSPQ